MTTWAIFNDEGLAEELEALDKQDAEEEFRASEWADDEHAYVAEVCHDHPEQPRVTCETCNAEEEEEEQDDAEDDE